MNLEGIREATELLRAFVHDKFRVAPETVRAPQLSRVEGEATSVAYPILGIEKYLGMADPRLRIAYFPSLSVSHDAARTVCHVIFRKSFSQDLILVDGQPALPSQAERAARCLRIFREETGVATRAVFVFQNRFAGGIPAKGLGLSSSVAAAAATAMLTALGGANVARPSLVSRYARLVSGSGSRAATGGVSVWYSYSGIDDWACVSERLREADLSLLVYPRTSEVSTSQAHEAVVRAPGYALWAGAKPHNLLLLARSLLAGDWESLGVAAERDSLAMHSVLESVGMSLLTDEARRIAQAVLRLRAEGLRAYTSIDTGSTVFVLCFDRREEIADGIARLTGTTGFPCGTPTADRERASTEESDALRAAAHRALSGARGP